MEQRASKDGPFINKRGNDIFYCKEPKDHDFVRDFGYVVIISTAKEKLNAENNERIKSFVL